MDLALVLLTGALVATTVAYSVFTALMVREMRRTQMLGIRPRLALAVEMISPNAGYVGVPNVGPGTALDVRVTLEFRPWNERREWRAHVLFPGEKAEIAAPQPTAGSPLEMEPLANEGAHAQMSGTMRDVNGEEHPVHGELDIASGGESLVPPTSASANRPKSAWSGSSRRYERAWSVETGNRCSSGKGGRMSI